MATPIHLPCCLWLLFCYNPEWVVKTETTWPAEPQIFTAQLFIDNVCQHVAQHIFIP